MFRGRVESAEIALRVNGQVVHVQMKDVLGFRVTSSGGDTIMVLPAVALRAMSLGVDAMARERLTGNLEALAAERPVWPSQANLDPVFPSAAEPA